MQELRKKLTLVLICLGIMLFISCTDEINDEVADENQATVEDVKEVLTITTTIPSDQDEISLPISMNGYDGVTINWTSSNSSIISNEGVVIHPAGTGTTAVDLTATITKGSASVIKVITVTVNHECEDLTDEDYITQAKTLLSFEYTKDVYIDQIVVLPQSVAAYGQSVSVVWSTSNTDYLELNEAKTECTVHRDIVDVPVNLVASLSYGSATGSKTIEVTVEYIPMISATFVSGATVIYTFSKTSDGTYNLVTDYTSSSGKKTKLKYTYTADTSAKRMTTTVVENCIDEVWTEKQTYINDETEKWIAQADAYITVAESPSMENFLTAWRIENNDSTITMDSLIQQIVESLSRYFDNVTSAEEFNELTEEQKQAGVIHLLDSTRSTCALRSGLVSTATWNDLKTKGLQDIITEADCLYLSNIDYSYAITTDRALSFSGLTVWSSDKEWYEQVSYYLYNADNYIYYRIDFYSYYIQYGTGSYDDDWCVPNSDFTKFTSLYTGDVWNVSFENGILTFEDSDNSLSVSYRYFEGKPLYLNWY